jgi:hypothetical protein
MCEGCARARAEYIGCTAQAWHEFQEAEERARDEYLKVKLRALDEYVRALSANHPEKARE